MAPLLSGYAYEWDIVPKSLGYLLQGLVFTLDVAVVSLVLSLVVGLFVAVARMSSRAPLRAIGFAYVQVFRALSLYVYILLVYFAWPALTGVSFGTQTTAIICLTLLHSAYVSEIYRSAIAAVDRGQYEAAASLGMGRVVAFLNVELPQAFRTALPSLVNQLVDLVKDSSIIATIGAADLMYRTIQLVANTNRSFELYTATALIYLTVIVVLSQLARLLEGRLRVHLA